MLPRNHIACLRTPPCKRTFAASSRTTQPVDAIRRDLRALLRDTAQPVAVVTSLMPASAEDTSSSSHARFHGATLSSFTSIALDPHLLVAFSLRIPSRMATSLSSAHATPTSTYPAATPPTPAPASPPLPAQMVINILSAAQPAVAARFARPDLHPDPFAHTPHALSAEGLPVLAGALGALSCRLVAASWPLHDLDSLRGRDSDPQDRGRAWDGEGVASELFIAQVTRVEEVPKPREGEDGHDGLSAAPLLYYRRAYATTRALDEYSPSKSS